MTIMGFIRRKAPTTGTRFGQKSVVLSVGSRGVAPSGCRSLCCGPALGISLKRLRRSVVIDQGGSVRLATIGVCRGPVVYSSMCRFGKGGINCLTCANFSLGSVGPLVRVKGGFGTRNVRRLILSLQCGKKNCIVARGILTSVFTPRRTIDDGGMFRGRVCGDCLDRDCRGRKRDLRAHFAARFGCPRIRIGTDAGSTGVRLGGVCKLVNSKSTSTSRTLLNKLVPCAGIQLVNARARNGCYAK